MKKLFSLFIICSTTYLAIAQQEMVFRSFSTEDGLSNASVRVTYQDQFGFIWIGTRGGLNRFDGNEIIQFLKENDDTTSIVDSYISDIYQLSKNELLIGTFGGLEVYNYGTKTFRRFNDSRLLDTRIYDIHSDVDSALWISTSNGLFSIDHSKVTQYTNDIKDSLSLSNDHVYATTSDDRFIYISTRGGLNILDKKTGHFRNKNNDTHAGFQQAGFVSYAILKSTEDELWFSSTKESGEVTLNRFDLTTEELFQYSVGNNGLSLFFAVLSIYQDPSGTLYFGMNGGGFYTYDRAKNWFYNYTHDPKNENTISDIDVWDVFRDRNMNLWIGTDGGGVNYHHPLFNRFSAMSHNPHDDMSLGVNDTHDFYEDEQYVWVGNNTLGLSRLDKSTGQFHNYPFTDDSNYSLLDYTVFAVEGGDNGNIWIGSYEGGLSRLDPKTGQFKHIVNDDNHQPLPANYISDILERDGVLWLGTANGLGSYTTKTNEIKHFPRVFDQTDFNDDINVLTFENDQTLWVGSAKGLFRFNTQTQIIDSTGTVLDSLYIGAIAILEDDIWIGTKEGLIQYTNENKIKWYRTFDGLSNDNILGLEFDSNGNLWCITPNGLNVYNPLSKSFTNFYAQDGLAGNQFNKGSIYKGINGMFYAGGLKGFTRWNPQQITMHTNEPGVVFTDLFNKKEDKEIHTSLINVSEIVLNDDDDFISVHFFSDEIIEKSKTKFAYRIRELNSKNWIDINDWKVDLIDLRPGDYTLDVKASNYDGIWGNHSTLKVRVLPPIWNTNYAYAFYGLVIIGLLLLRDRYLKTQRIKLEKTVEERTHEIRKQKEIVERDKATIDDQNKVIAKSLEERESLLKEIHHRVKNNLQIIASLLYLQSGKFDDEDYKKVLEEGQGRVRSMALIHQKLYENDDLKSIPFEEYLTELVGEIRASFGQSMAKIELNIQASNIYFDVDTAVPLGLIVNELATNAFKYAFSHQDRGSFSIFLQEDQGSYSLHIKDDGKGLPEEIDLRKAKSLGLRLVRMLSQQLEGEFQISGTNGTSFELKFAA